MKTLTLFITMILILVLCEGISKADFVFSEPSEMPNINTSSYDSCGSITSDGLELYIASYDPYGGDGCHGDIYVVTRSTTEDEWSVPTKLGSPVNTDGPEDTPCISADGLELYFTDGWNPTLLSCLSHRPGGYGDTDIWVSTRTTKDDPWDEPINLGLNINSSSSDSAPSISSDGLSLYFHSFKAGGYGFGDIYVAKRQTKDDPWDPAENLGTSINTSAYEISPFISPDNLSLYFSRGHFSGSDSYTYQIYVSRRSSDTAPWERPVPFDPGSFLKSLYPNPSSQYRLTFAQGCSMLYFDHSINWSQNPSNYPTTVSTTDVWQVEVTPVVDFNSDGIVDSADMCILVDNWHTENSLCDIAPGPMGDGFVDVQDLIVLAEHLFEEIPPAEEVE